MLEARAAKHDASFWRMRRDVRCDIYDAQGKIGALVYDAKSESATLTVRGQAFAAARERARRDEALCQAALRSLVHRFPESAHIGGIPSRCAGDYPPFR